MVFKKILFSTVCLITFLLLAEFLLRIINFHYYPLDIGFTITPAYKIFKKVNNYYETKQEKINVFPDQRFPVKKDKNEVRIFILGGSSVNRLGRVELLRSKLQREFLPDKKIRIINIGGNSYGTNRLLLQMQEIVEYAPDLAILYSGHNEFEEEFIRRTFF